MAEEIGGSYKSDSIVDYSLYFVGAGNYTSNSTTDPFLFIVVGITQFSEPSVTKITINEEGEPLIAEYHASKKLLDKEFKDVYSNIAISEFTSYSELFYNAEFGIIGFRDKQDDLFVFKEFIE